MLYIVSYEESFPGKKEEAAYQHELARRLLAYAMEREYGLSLADLEIGRGEHGKPYFVNHPAGFSLSHTAGAACCGLSDSGIGVDCEKVRPVSDALVNRVCTDSELRWLDSASDRERAFFTLWTLKESLMKMTGQGMSMGFRNASFSFSKGRPVPDMPGVKAASCEVFPGYFVSVCTEGPLPEQIRFIPLDRLPNLQL